MSEESQEENLKIFWYGILQQMFSPFQKTLASRSF